MRTVSLLVLLSTAMWAAVPHASGVFEEAGGGATAWVGWSGASEMLVFAEGFALRSGERVLRFRWDRSLGLNSLQPEGMAPSNVYELSAAGPGRQLAHAGRIRVRSKSGGISILYYFGLRGLEFDIEAPAGAPVSYLRLESEDADFSRDELGRILVNGRLFALQPVAYTEDGSGRRLPVEAGYRVESKRVVRFEIGSHSVDERLVVDPVVTYATYFFRNRPGGASGCARDAGRDGPDRRKYEELRSPDGSIADLGCDGSAARQFQAAMFHRAIIGGE